MQFKLQPKIPFLTPTLVVSKMDLAKGQKVIEFGSGPGFWTIPMAKKVGKEGMVIAIDNRIENLGIIKSKAERIGLKNIKYLEAPYNSKVIPTKEKADLILFSNILSISKTWSDLLSTVNGNAKKGTKMIVIDWKDEKFLFEKKDLKKWMEDIIIKSEKSGFVFRKLIDVGGFHFGLYFEYLK